jgi:hypothetical protein
VISVTDIDDDGARAAGARKIECINLLGFRVEKTTNFTSMAALILSLVSVFQAAAYFFQSSELTLIQPDRVMLFEHKCHTSRYSIPAIVLPVSVVNKTKLENKSVLRESVISFALDQTPYDYASEYYVATGRGNKSKSGLVGCNSDDKLLFFVEAMKREPIEIIAGGAAFGQSVMFLPHVPQCPKGGDDCYRKNYVSFVTLIEALDKLEKASGVFALKVRLRYDDRLSEAMTCSISVNQDVLLALRTKRHIDVACQERGSY